MIKLEEIRFDCRHFNGHIPCKPNKLYDSICTCDHFDKIDSKILIIKLGAAGDVIRTTPLLYPIKEDYPNSRIYWLTYSADLVPQYNKGLNIGVDHILDYNLQNISFLKEVAFDLVINLDKDKEAISLTESLTSKRKLGFTIKDGFCYPINEDGEHKFITGLFDNISAANTKNYMEEIFEICGYKFKGEKYLLDIYPEFDLGWDIDKSKRVVGLNTGCGSRWTSRLWSNENWEILINTLITLGYEVVLLGGPEENERNSYLTKASGAKYFGTYNLKTFINLVNKCDIVVSQVTMGFHIALALGKKIALMNNIFNPNEFELYGNGRIVQPRKECKCYFSPKCVNPDYKCMEHMMPEDIVETIKSFN